MITRDVCLIILHKALAALQNINTTVETAGGVVLPGSGLRLVPL